MECLLIFNVKPPCTNIKVPIETRTNCYAWISRKNLWLFDRVWYAPDQWRNWWEQCANRLPWQAKCKNWAPQGSFSGIWCSFVCGVWSLWRHNLTSYSCFQTKALAKCVDIIRIFFYTPSPYFMCHCTEYKLSALQVRISDENKLNATTQEIITATFWLRVEKGE